ncbi:MAG: hypothetical protein IJU37_04750 [Desulfovibrio sp.]|nr:hypothetical protein [Desulfovibrio sp.]
MFSFMLFLFFGFLAVYAILMHMLRMQAQAYRLLHDEHAQLRLQLLSLEARLDAFDVAPAETAPEGMTENPGPHVATRLVARAAKGPAEDDLLRLSFAQPAADEPAVDPALDLHFDPGEEGRQRAENT